MKRSAFFLAFAWLLSLPSLAEGPLFSVILNKGENTFGSDQKFTLLIPGARLNADDQIRVEDGGYVALIYEPLGTGIEIREAGVYSISKLEQKAKDESRSVLAKYGKFLMSKLTNDNDERQNLNVTGAVERGDADVIEVYFPKVADVYGDRVIISWRRVDDLSDYVLTVKDKLDKTIMVKNVKGTSYTLNLDQTPLAEEEMLVVNVKAKDRQNIVSGDFGIKRITLPEERQIEEEYSAIRQVAGSDNALNQLLLASFFEENELLADALYCYHQAMQISPDRQGFMRIYHNFLVRNGLK